MNNFTKSLASISIGIYTLSATTVTPEQAQMVCEAGSSKIDIQLDQEADFQKITAQFEAETIQAQEKEAIKSHLAYPVAKYGVALVGASVGAYFAPAILTYSAITFVPTLYGCIFSAPSSYAAYSIWWAGQYNAIGAVISQGFYPAIFTGAGVAGGLAAEGFELFTDAALYTKNKFTEFDTEYGISSSISDAYSDLSENALCTTDIKKNKHIIRGKQLYNGMGITPLGLTHHCFT